MKMIIALITMQFLSHASFLPQNLETPPGQMNILLLQENKKMVKQTIRKFKKTFRKQASGKISVNDVWWSTTFNAYAMKYGPIWRITIHGGLLKHQSLTSDLLSLVLCHELGHFLGAAPKFSMAGRKWSSYEGQADYWTGQRCLKKLFKNDDNISVTQNMNVDPLATKSCDLIYSTELEQALCYRVSMVGLSMGELISEITGKNDPRLDTPDLTVVEQTYKDHPNFQCRVDTYFQGALCKKTDNLSDTDASLGTCFKEQVGNRPSCWFNNK